MGWENIFMIPGFVLLTRQLWVRSRPTMNPNGDAPTNAD